MVKKSSNIVFTVESGFVFRLDIGKQFIKIDVFKLSSLDKKTLMRFCVEVLKNLI